MNRRDDDFPAKSVRRKRAIRSHGRDLLRPNKLQQPEHRYHQRGIFERRHIGIEDSTLDVTATVTIGPVKTVTVEVDEVIKTTIFSSDIVAGFQELADLIPPSSSQLRDLVLSETDATLPLESLSTLLAPRPVVSSHPATMGPSPSRQLKASKPHQRRHGL